MMQTPLGHNSAISVPVYCLIIDVDLDLYTHGQIRNVDFGIDSPFKDFLCTA